MAQLRVIFINCLYLVKLKLERIPLNVLLHRYFVNYLCLSLHLLPRMNVMLDFI